jgi:hypothetical protein
MSERRFLALAVVIAATFTTSVAVAGTIGPIGCQIPPGQACRTPGHHEFDDAGAYAPNSPSTYVGADIVSLAGTARAICYGYGSCYAYYRDNNATQFYGWWGNHSSSGTGTKYVQGTFHY